MPSIIVKWSWNALPAFSSFFSSSFALPAALKRVKMPGAPESVAKRRWLLKGVVVVVVKDSDAAAADDDDDDDDSWKARPVS
jgi:hypothetical protein